MKQSIESETGASPGRGAVARKAKGARPSGKEVVATSSSAADGAALDARKAEIRWLTQHYGARIRTLLNDNEALRRRIKTLIGASETAQIAPTAVGDMGQLQELRAELAHITAANERYLARIYELKAQIASAGTV